MHRCCRWLCLRIRALLPRHGPRGKTQGLPGGAETGFITGQLFEARIKANDIVQEHLKQIITIASATLALTVSFVKDIIGGSSAQVQFAWLLRWSWVALGVAILGAVICVATLVDNLDAPDLSESKKKPFIKAFAAATHWPVVIFESMALYPFAIGMLSLALFGAANYRLFLERKTETAQVAKDANHFTIVTDPDHVGPAGKKHSHTFLLDQKSGAVWDVYCRPDGTVEFRSVAVDGLTKKNSP